MSKIICSFSSIPFRKDCLVKSVQSIYDQVDEINLFLNNYPEVPEELNLDKVVNIVMSNNAIGDAGKFYWADKVEGYYLACDDDILYPPDYVSSITNAIDEHRCLVSYHGRKINLPTKSYYKSGIRYRCFDKVSESSEVTTVGSGVCGFHTDIMKPSIDFFKEPNMADVWISAYAKDREVSRICLAHRAGWISPLKCQGPEIYNSNDDKQTYWVNKLI